jgi:hypothetical protein
MEKKRYGSFWDILGWKTIEALCSANKYALYPIPSDALFNANLSQNPGY